MAASSPTMAASSLTITIMSQKVVIQPLPLGSLLGSGLGFSTLWGCMAACRYPTITSAAAYTPPMAAMTADTGVFDLSRRRDKLPCLRSLS